MTGWGRGYCSGQTPQPGAGRRFGRGGGQGYGGGGRGYGGGGRGYGGGRGAGWGAGAGWNAGPSFAQPVYGPEPVNTTPEAELNVLRNQAEAMRQSLEQIELRVQQLQGDEAEES
ncbi:MAG: DUF5320 family protein [Deltaproteobacteria bacterium]|nr:DUF5320 family protein [Deltaproteobacteria bacterium]